MPTPRTNAGGVNSNTGRALVGSFVNLSSHGFNIPFSTGLYYDNQAGGASVGFGPNWLSGPMSGLAVIGGNLYRRTSATRTVQFKETSIVGTFKASYFNRDTITRTDVDGSPVYYTLLKPDGSRQTFDAATGRPLSIITAGGASCSYAYASGVISTVTGSFGGKTWQYVYAWTGSKVDSITYKVEGREVAKCVYAYDTTGRLKTIKKYENSTAGATADADWGTPVEAVRFSYHPSGLLRHVIPPAQYRQMVAGGLNPEGDSEPELNAFAESEYEYGAANRVSKVYTHGRSYTFELSYGYSGLSGDVFNTWRTKTEIKRPGYVVETFYLNGVGQVMLRRFQQKDSSGTVLKTWYPVFQKFQSGGGARIILSAAASAIDDTTFSESNPGLVSLRTDAGLVTEYFYNAQGLLQYTQQRRGTTSTTVARISELTYEERTVSGLGTIWPVKTEMAFRDAAGTVALTTTYDYLWHSDAAALQPSKIITTYPAVAPSENGTGAATTESNFDALGYLTSEVDAVGTATTYEYDKVRGALTVRIEDQGTGLNLRTDYEVDDLGRTVATFGPEHVVDIGGTAKAIRSATWLQYKDRSHETWTIRGYRDMTEPNPALRDHTVGAVRIERRFITITGLDHPPEALLGWRVDWSIDATYSGAGIPAQSATFDSLFTRDTWQSWKISLYDMASQLRDVLTYWQIPDAYGTVDVDYGTKRFDYDSAGRQNQTTCAGGTTDRTNYNAVGWPLSEELGVDADPATYTVTRTNEFNDDGNLTKATLPVGTGTPDRVTDFRYDWRDRLEERETKVQKDSSEGSGDWTLITKYTRDNRGLITAVANYHTAAIESNLTGLIEMAYDSRGRRYRTKEYAVDSGGHFSNPQESNLWYDANGQVLKDAPSGSKLFTATEFNAVGWAKKVYRAYDTGTPPTVPPFVTSSTTVIEQVNYDYDDAGNLTATTAKQRYDDATGAGPLGDAATAPKARVTYVANYPDALGRSQASADYGTNSVSPRPSIIPARGGAPRVTSLLYNALGNPESQTDPAGIQRQQSWDKASRLTETVENWLASPTTDTRTTRFKYTSDSWLKELISLNPDTGTGTQTTKWVYGVTKGTGPTDSRVSSKRLVREKLFPGAAQPVAYRYNIQRQMLGLTDQLGTVHAYDYDKLARLVADTVIAFGSGVDATVGKLANGYNNRGLLIRSASHNTAGSTVLNEIAWDYNGFDQPVAEYQEHAGSVTKSTSLKVVYSYADGSASTTTTRPTAIKYPHAGSGSATTLGIEYASTMASALSRPDQLKDGGDILSSWRYTGLTMVVGQKYDAASNTELTYGTSTDAYSGYNPFGEIIATLWKTPSAVLVQSTYGRNAVGAINWRRDDKAATLLSPTTQDNYYWYDRLRQVTRHDRGKLTGPPYGSIATPQQQQENFNYDETGNWKQYATLHPTLDQHRSHNVANQITGIAYPSGAVNPAYDAAGNMTTVPSALDWTVGDLCKWDAWNRLVSIRRSTSSSSSSSGSSSGLTSSAVPPISPSSSSSSSSTAARALAATSSTSTSTSSSSSAAPVVPSSSSSSSSSPPFVEATYVYDALTRRIRKGVAGGETRDYYFNRQWRAIEERVGGVIKADHAYSPFDRWNLIRRRRSVSSALDEVHFVLRDYLDPVAIITAAGAAAGVAAERYGYDAFGPARIMGDNFATRAASVCAWNWLFHGEFLDADTGLYNYGYRYYHPQLGRWLSRDPIGENGGLNLYGFVWNTPLDRYDHFGLGFWSTLGSIIDIIPIVGTIKNLAFPPSGARGSDYVVHLDSKLCDDTPEIAQIQCEQDIDGQMAKFLGLAIGTTAAHDVLDALLAFLGGATGLIPLVLGVDAAVDTLATIYDLGKIVEAAGDAKKRCICPALLGCIPGSQYDQA